MFTRIPLPGPTRIRYDGYCKGQFDINEKEQSLPGDVTCFSKANFLNANYFNASAFRIILMHSFPENTKLVQSCYLEARSLIYLNNLRRALDSALLKISYKNTVPADLYATNCNTIFVPGLWTNK